MRYFSRAIGSLGIMLGSFIGVWAQHTIQPSGPASQKYLTRVINADDFSIPFNIPAGGEQPTSVQLHVSRNNGQDWTLVDQLPANARKFRFQAKEDGPYWFTTRTLRGHGGTLQSTHSALTHAEPQLLVVVDRIKPTVSINAMSDGSGQIFVDFTVKDLTPTRRGLQVDYRTDTNPHWTPVTVAENDWHNHANGSTRIVCAPPSSWRQADVRVTVRDRAENQGVAIQRVEKPRVANGKAFQLTNRQEIASPRANLSLDVPVREPVNMGFVSNENSNAVAGSHRQQRQNGMPMPHAGSQYVPSQPTSKPLRGADPIRFANNGTPIQSPSLPTERSSSPANLSNDLSTHHESQSFNVTPNPKPRRSIEDAVQPIPVGGDAFSRNYRASETRPAPANRDIPPEHFSNPQTDPPTEYVETASPHTSQSHLLSSNALVSYSDSKQFALEYEVEAVGSGGLERVELWGSKDRGKSWQRWANDEDKQSPFDIETQSEGLYGFRIVVVGANGLTNARPLPGDRAEMYVVIDTTAPVPQIVGAKYGEGNDTGKLVISYDCDVADDSLKDRPVTLQFSEGPDGPWTVIASGLARSGRYVWAANPQLPRRIYLRIQAVDQAGNVGWSVLDAPIDVQGLAPRARIRGFQPINDETAARIRRSTYR